MFRLNLLYLVAQILSKCRMQQVVNKYIFVKFMLLNFFVILAVISQYLRATIFD